MSFHICIVLLLLVLIVSRMLIKNKIIKVLLGIVASLLAIFVLLSFLFYYSLNYAVSDVDNKVSDDGKYTVVLKSVGSPIFFSSADGRLVLKEGNHAIVKYDFELFDDGGCIRPSIWSVEWCDDHVKIIISGEEQCDKEYDLFYDGTRDTKQLESKK